eukprot:1323103-Amphidinium_carterae.1
MTDAAICEKYKLDTFQALVDKRRLQALRRMLCADVDPVRAALSASFGATSVWSGMFDSMKRLKACCVDELVSLPVPKQESVAAWCEYILDDQQRWRAMVRRHRCDDPPLSEKRSAADVEQIFE